MPSYLIALQENYPNIITSGFYQNIFGIDLNRHWDTWKWIDVIIWCGDVYPYNACTKQAACMDEKQRSSCMIITCELYPVRSKVSYQVYRQS